MLTWVPDIEPIDAEDAWHPEDALFAPLIGADGRRVGVLSVDVPHDGRRPNAATCKALEGFAVSTALAIEHATLRARAEASEDRLREQASHDALTGVRNRSMLFERLGTRSRSVRSSAGRSRSRSSTSTASSTSTTASRTWSATRSRRGPADPLRRTPGRHGRALGR